MTKYLILAIVCLILLIANIIVLLIEGHYPYKTIDELEEELNNLENRVKEIEENE